MILYLKQSFTVVFLCFCFSQVHSQTKTEVSKQPKENSHAFFYQYRANNVFTAAVGTAVINGDYQDPLFEFYGQVGYKRYINPYVNVNFTYNKFNLAHKNISNNGYMSFDLNVESTMMPDSFFTPFVFAGAGVNASNYFTTTDMKIQGGIGVEYIIMEDFGIKLFTDYNHTFSDELDGKVFGDANDVYWRIAFGVNYYFGRTNKKSKIPSDVPTIINSNPIIHN
ncbi:Curli production assembly/transport component CsgG [Lacinutrix himadriensis]|uniref:Curli production assembly/transport component CsgG n=1 Tax=Lacinutrix himadriensis TaxID=641549 RepID=UPI000A6CCD2C|nr:Curli production assembly/transport component CsgG [Lacinutrix himadriensis]